MAETTVVERETGDAPVKASGRPLPQLTLQNKFFWTSGEDGRLRIQECESCSALIHPPQPVCRYCREKQMGVRVVSGYATLIGFTVNHRFGLPGLPPPFVIAQVALEEDSRVRLTTNTVECDAEQLELGMRMEVVFHRDGDVWLPLFRPAAEQSTPAPLPVDDIEPEQIRFHIRPPASPDKFEDKVALTGIGMSDIGRRLMVDPVSLTVQACERAVADAGLTMDDIDGLSWRGFHHHATLCIAAYGFLVSERSRFSPSAPVRLTTGRAFRLSEADQPRGCAHPPRTSRRPIDRHHPG